MSKFLTPCDLRIANDIDDGKFILLSSLVYQSDLIKQTIVVPAGFRTDLASIPRLPIIYWLMGATSSEASIVHDYLYTSHTVNRAMADAVFREASAVIKVPAWRRWAIWAGVRIGGGSHW